MERCTQYWLVILSVYSCFIHKINRKMYSILIGDFISVLMFHPLNTWKGVLNTWLVILSVYSCFIHKINRKIYSILIGDFISVLMFHPQNKWKMYSILIGDFISVLMFHPLNTWKGVLNIDWWFYQCTHVSSTK